MNEKNYFPSFELQENHVTLNVGIVEDTKYLTGVHELR